MTLGIDFSKIIWYNVYMKLNIELSLYNEAMQDDTQIANVLRKIAENIENGAISWTEEEDGSYSAVPRAKINVSDSNGNVAGFWEVEGE